MTTTVSLHSADTMRWRIATFFDWFRQRSTNIAALTGITATERHGRQSGSYLPEQHALVSANLDALAGFWARSYGPPGMPHAGRMGEFLALHGDPSVFTRVSGPDLLRRGRSPGKGSLTPAQQAALQREVPDDAASCRIRRWTEDPDLDALAARLASDKISRAWLARSRYGEVIYHYHRCNWIHEMSGHADLAPEPSWNAPREPGYDNVLGSGAHRHVRRRLALPLPFLLTTLEDVIESFERQCLADSRDPSP